MVGVFLQNVYVSCLQFALCELTVTTCSMADFFVVIDVLSFVFQKLFYQALNKT